MKSYNLAKTWAAGAICVSLTGCASSAPRAFMPISEPPSAAKTQAFARAYAMCTGATGAAPTQVSQSQADNGQKATRAKSNIMLGTATGAVVGTAAAGTVATAVTGVTGSFLAGGVAVVLAPVAIGYGAYRGATLLERNKKEKELKDNITSCMAAKRQTISSWVVLENGETSPLSTSSNDPKGK